MINSTKVKKSNLEQVSIFDSAFAPDQLDTLLNTMPINHIIELFEDGCEFYQTTFWMPFDRPPVHEIENAIHTLRDKVPSSAGIVGVEWWLSVVQINANQQWLLPYHFDRENLEENDPRKVRHPNFASVLYLNDAPYGELVVTDQTLTPKGISSAQPNDMRFILPRENTYVVFPGNLLHGVIGRLWRDKQQDHLRVAMAINYWSHKPRAEYLFESREALKHLELLA